MTFDYLISGQGIAGSVLAYTLLRQGKKVGLVDAGTMPSSSRVAAGIYNPVTGRKLVKTWKADLLFPFLSQFYREMEAELGTSFLHPTPVYRPFHTVEEQRFYLAQTAAPGFSDFITATTEADETVNVLCRALGGLKTKKSGYVDVSVMLDALRSYFEKHEVLMEDYVDPAEIVLTPTGVEWKKIKASKVIFCEGAYVTSNAYFNWLPFRPVKGEILTISLPQSIPSYVYNYGVYVLPLPNGTCKVGATYNWRELDWEISENARKELIEKLDKVLALPYRVVEHEAGIRPATADRRPFVGLHPEYESVGIFNGLGTKGISLAPYFARQFYEFLEQGKELDQEVNISRHFSLYFSEREKAVRR